MNKIKIIYSLIIFIILYIIFVKEFLYLVTTPDGNIKSITYLKKKSNINNELINLPFITLLLVILSYLFANVIIR